MVLAENLLKELYQMAANHDRWTFAILGICIVLITMGIGYASFKLLFHKSSPSPIVSVFLFLVPAMIAAIIGSRILEPQIDKRKPSIRKKFQEQQNLNQGKPGSLTDSIL